MGKPEWIECLERDQTALTSFKDFIGKVEGDLLKEMRTNVKENKMEEARVCAGESIAWKKIRDQLSMYKREEQQNGIIQER